MRLRSRSATDSRLAAPMETAGNSVNEIAPSRRVLDVFGHPVIQCCQVHKVWCALATCYVSAVRSLSTQPAPAVM